MRRPCFFLKTRSQKPEMMDLPHSDKEKLYRTLRHFSLINLFFTGSRKLLRRTVLRDMEQSPKTHRVLLEIGSGGGDTARWLIKKSRSMGLSLSIICCEKDPRAVEFLRTACAKEPCITIVEADFFDLSGPAYEVDYVFANHLLHHLADAQIPPMLTQAYQRARRGVVFNDLRRSCMAYVLYFFAASLFFRKSFARKDGLLSIQKGFTHDEAQNMLRACPDIPLVTRGTFPFRCIWKSSFL
ncbi:methyltransferase domain-containing protein [Chitinivibrio alkaliphilus]|uniref:SAM-dependent methyltransferase n=1 Tax=Chitinivibrio alkaliphilus ACht1 TaxID=1313304 RepID=U7DCQ1_9BACT|nr:methyltransferase domain-containing protein [Chitinivibrio alkaliphilus]ERP38676.1 SAM-dependent methyltransferase [Chitinivibrio alkaliphilus ACht1]